MRSLLRFYTILMFMVPTLVQATVLENPSGGNFYSGVGVVSGWKCDADGSLTVRFYDVNMEPVWDPIPLAYPNERPDTASVCGDTNNGFVAIWNWANLGDGTYTAVVDDNGVEFGRSTFTVTTLGEAFLTGAQARVTVADFPDSGETVTLEWNQSTQHFEIVEARGDILDSPAPSPAPAAVLENPTHGLFYSGIGVISGWKCEATGPLTARFYNEELMPLGDPIPLAYRNERPDTAGVCGDTDNGFVAIWNWGNLGDGTYTTIVSDNGEEFARSTFTVTTTGEAFLTGARARVTVEDFPDSGETIILEWNQGTQHFEIVEALAPYDRAYWRQVSQDIFYDFDEVTLSAGVDDFPLYASAPDLSSCSAGTLTQEAKDQALESMNQIRALHGLAAVRYSSLYDTSVQEAALIQAANDYLTHHPEPGDRCYTEAGDEASGSSNLSGGFIGTKTYPADDMIGWTHDALNVGLTAAAGHRRWMLNPFATYMSYGQVEGYGVQKVFGFDREPDINPQVEVDYVAFPYETYPAILIGVFPSPPWSFSVVEDKSSSFGNWHRYFDSATVSVTRVSDGTSVTVSDLYTDTDGFGVPNFLSWNVAYWELEGGTLYQVEIDNVAMRSGETRSFSYRVYIDPAE